MGTTNKKMRQLVDWRAAFWAGIGSGLIFFLANILLPPLFGFGNVWMWVRLFASILLGSHVLAPPATFEAVALLSAIGVNLVLSLVFGALVAFVVHRGGFVAGVIGGALLGLALYFINFYSLTYFYPWFFAMKSNVMIATHVLFGAMAGGIYESLEVERFVPDED